MKNRLMQKKHTQVSARTEKQPARRQRPKSEAERQSRVLRGYFAMALIGLVLAFGALPVLAAGDPLASINKLSDFIFSAIKAIGLILLGFGVVQIGLSLKSHDPGQRAQGIMAFFGGVVIAFAKDILDLIV